MALTDDLELAFRKSWLLLYSRGVGEGYINALKTFIQAGIRAYRSGYTLEALNLELVANQKVTGDPLLDDFLRLDPQELDIRTTWLKLIYVTLTRLDGLEPPPDSGNLLDLVLGVIEAHQKGYTLDALKLELVLQTPEPARTQEESSILSQWMRLVFLTLESAQDSQVT